MFLNNLSKYQTSNTEPARMVSDDQNKWLRNGAGSITGSTTSSTAGSSTGSTLGSTPGSGRPSDAQGPKARTQRARGGMGSALTAARNIDEIPELKKGSGVKLQNVKDAMIYAIQIFKRRWIAMNTA